MSAGGSKGSSKPRSNLINDTFDAMIPGTTQNVAIGAASAQATAFQNTTSVVRLFSTVDCYVQFGSSVTGGPTATNASMFLPGGIVEYFGVPAGAQSSPTANVPWQVAVTEATGASGTLYITEGL